MKQPLTTEEKANKKKRDNLKVITNSIRSAWSMKQITSWMDVYKKLGFSVYYIQSMPESEKPASELTWPNLKTYLEKMEKDLDEQINKTNEQIDKTEATRKASIDNVERLISSISYPDVETRGSQDSSPEAMREEVVKGIVQEVYKKGQEAAKKEQEEGLISNKDYGLVPSPNENVFFYWFQKKAVAEACKKIFEEKKTGILLLAATGTGKTFITLGIARRALDRNWHVGKGFSPVPYLYTTRTTVVTQTERVAKMHFGITPGDNIDIFNIEQLRSGPGEFWIRDLTKTLIVEGEEVAIEKYQWKPGINPVIWFNDESQSAKNKTSKTHKITCAYNDLQKDCCLVSISATPFVKVSEAKSWAVSTHRTLDHLGFPKGTCLTNETWDAYAKIIAQGNPDDLNEAAIGRLMKDLEDWVVRVRGVRAQFPAHNFIERISFKTKEEAEFYHTAEKRFVERKAKYKEMIKLGIKPELHIFTIMQQYALAAEVCRYERIADKMWEMKEKGFAVCAAVKFKATLIAIEQCLEKKYGVNRNDICLVWGGGQTQLTKKQKAKHKIKEMAEVLKKQGLDAESLMEDLDLDKVEDRELLNLPASSRLGMQSLIERQTEIDGYQSGKKLFCIYTFKAGGVGLSLHHTDELITYKCKRKESGYAVESDIVNVSTRPRFNVVAPTYSAIELIQGVGRCPRLTSLSVTEQVLLFYKGTIEDDIADIVSAKLRCASVVAKMHESWQDFIIGTKPKEFYIDSTKDVPDDEAGTVIGESDTEDEE